MSVPSENEEEIFDAARRLPTASARSDFLTEACGGDAGLRLRVERLLTAAEDSAGFFAEQDSGVEDEETLVMSGTGKTSAPSGIVSASLQPGSKVGRYVLREEIGEGGFGVVYRAEQFEPVKREVALKIVKLGMDTEAVVGRFEAERQSLALMEHPNIAQVLDAGATDTGRPYFVMELVRGLPITDYCDRKTASTEERLQLFAEVCGAVQHAHQKGVIHRDIKPSNVLIAEHDGKAVPKIIDFGIAKATRQEEAEKEAFTQMGQFVGTPAYMSPEQARGNEVDIDTRSDIYSLGVLLYELLTGTTPFDAKELRSAGFEEIRRRIREDEPPRPSMKVSTLGRARRQTVAEKRRTEPHTITRLLRGDLDWIVMKALEKERDRRYETANGLAQDIRRYLQHEPVTASPPSLFYLLGKFAARNKAFIIAVSAVALALVLGLVGMTLLYFESEANRETAVRNEAIAKQNEQLAVVARSEAETQEQKARQAFARSEIALADSAYQNIDLAGMLEHLDACPAEFRDSSWDFLDAKASSTAVPVAPGRRRYADYTAGDATNGFFAIDRAGEIWRVNPTNGMRVAVAESGLIGAPIIRQSADGRRVVVAARGSREATLINTTTGEPIRKIETPYAVSRLAMSADGSRLFVATTNPARHLLLDLASGKKLWQNRGGIDVVAFDATGADIVLQPRSVSGAIRVLDATTGKTVSEFTVGGNFTALALSPSAEVVAIGDDDGWVKLLDLLDGGIRHQFNARSGAVRSVDFLGEDWLAVLAVNVVGDAWQKASEQRSLQVWSTRSGMRAESILALAPDVTRVVADRQSRSLLTDGARPGIWSLPLDREFARQPVDPENPMISFLGKNQVYLVAGDNRLAGFSIADGRLKPRKPALSGSLLIRGNGRRKFMATRFSNGSTSTKTVTIGNLKLRTQSLRIPIPPDSARGNAFHPNGHQLAVISKGSVKVYDVKSFINLERYNIPEGSVRAVRFADRGTKLAMLVARIENGHADDHLLIVDRESRDVVQRYPARGYLTALAASDDGRFVAVGGQDKVVRVIDVTAGQPVCEFRAHDQPITQLEFHPTNAILASASEDLSVRIWNYETGRPLARLLGPARPVESLAFNETGRRLAAGSSDGVARLWEVGEWLNGPRPQPDESVETMPERLEKAREQFLEPEARLTAAEHLPPLPDPARNGAPQLVEKMNDLPLSGQEAGFAGLAKQMMARSLSQPGTARVIWKVPRVMTTKRGQRTNRWEWFTHTYAEVREDLAAAHAAIARPELVFPADRNAEFTRSFHDLERLDQFIKLSCTATLDDLRNRELDAAADRIASLLRLLAQLRREPQLDNQYQYWADMHRVFRLQWEALAQDGWTDEQLARMQRGWEGFNYLATLEHSWSYQRAQMLELLRESREDFAAFRADSQGWLRQQGVRLPRSAESVRRWTQVGSVEEEIVILEYYHALIAATRAAAQAHSLAAAEEHLDRLPAVVGRARAWLTDWQFGRTYTGENVLRDFALADSVRSLALTALALRRHALKHGQFPAELSELVPQFLAKVPADFTCGQPLRYERTKEDFRLWSAGADGVDHGGDLTRVDFTTTNWNRLRDLVWLRPNN